VKEAPSPKVARFRRIDFLDIGKIIAVRTKVEDSGLGVGEVEDASAVQLSKKSLEILLPG
jgi:hypothetical protein